MSAPSTAGLAVDPAPGWLLVPVVEDPRAWAEAAQEQLRRALGAQDDWLPGEVLVSQLTLLAERVQRAAPACAFAHLPEQGGPDLLVEVLLLDLPSGTTLDEFVEEVSMPEEAQVDGPHLHQVATAAGPATKVRQRWRSDPSRVVLDTTAYLWLVPDRRAALLATTTTGDLVAAERAQAGLDQLAAGLRLLPA